MRWRIVLLLALVCAVMSVAAPRFASEANAIAVLKAASTHFLPAAGFTLVLAAGALDLSFASVMTMGGMAAVGLAPRLGVGGAALVAVLLGAAVGVVNGLLVARARVDAFIATLGTLTVVQGLVNIASQGGTRSLDDFTVADWLDRSSLLSPRVLIPVGGVLAVEAFLRLTGAGRSLLLIGGNRRAAWYAGVNTTRSLALAFVASGALSAAGGALFALSLSSASPSLGNGSLVLVIAATIIGGTAMAGGRGSALATATAVLMLVALTNGLSALGAGFEVQLIASGLVLAVTVLAGAAAERRADRWRGARPYLLADTAQ